MTKRIVYTRHDGGVNICQPSPEIMAWMSCGGYWNRFPRGYVQTQIERQIAAGHHEWAAVRFAEALAFGGCTTAEAFEIIRHRDCDHMGTAFEVWNACDVPANRWFRDAWVRSHNGGPINIDIRKARRIQFAKIKAAAAGEEKRRQADLDLFDRPVDLPWGTLRDRIHAAEEISDLRRIWPEGLI